MYSVEVFDDVIDQQFRELVWDYIQDQRWSIAWKKNPGENSHTLMEYVPSSTKTFKYKVTPPPSMFMPRACFGSDEHTLKQNHPIIFDLWKRIDAALGYQYVIEGLPEGMPAEKREKRYIPPAPKDRSLPGGWRVYANCQPNEYYKRTHGVHRDQPDITIDNTFTLLYVANLEWYPTWFGDCLYYPDDDTTGDHQQFQKSAQQRDFGIGWGDDVKIVSPKPGRIILYDSRQLHTTRPSAIWAEEDRKVIAFRLRKL